MLNGAFFEPLSSVDMKYLAYKTAFLLALTSVSRVSELHTIDVDIIHFGENNRNVYYFSGTGILVRDPESRGHTKSADQKSQWSLCVRQWMSAVGR
jgi:hypothetical protein